MRSAGSFFVVSDSQSLQKTVPLRRNRFKLRVVSIEQLWLGIEVIYEVFQHEKRRE